MWVKLVIVLDTNWLLTMFHVCRHSYSTFQQLNPFLIYSTKKLKNNSNYVTQI